jgi:hypothetical protein
MWGRRNHSFAVCTRGLLGTRIRSIVKPVALCISPSQSGPAFVLPLAAVLVV